MVIRSAGEGVLIDLAVNAPPDLPASATSAGPTLAPEELAGHKLLALFDRAAARDFADVYVLARRFGKNVMLARAAQIDAGFDSDVLADMIATPDRLGDDGLPVPEGTSAAELRAFYAAWRSELLATLRTEIEILGLWRRVEGQSCPAEKGDDEVRSALDGLEPGAPSASFRGNAMWHACGTKGSSSGKADQKECRKISMSSSK